MEGKFSKEVVLENIISAKKKIDDAARASGRSGSDVTLLAATKTVDADTINFAIDNGITCIGENRVQELVQKQPLGAYDGVPVHFIGHLQTNKVKQVVGKVDLIQSVDRENLLACIEKEAEKQNIVQNILLEVNIGAEESKSGFTPAQVMEMAGKMVEYPHCKLMGLMAIPPISQSETGNSKYFAEMYQIFVDITAKKYDNVNMVCLSMGMSDDYADAIRYGSTMIRVGTAIFGPRNYL